MVSDHAQEHAPGRVLDKVKKKIKIIAKTPLSKVLELGKVCSRKNNCCKHGSGFLVDEDIERIAKFLKISKEELKKKYLQEKELFNKKLLSPRLKTKDKPYGECIFFDKNGCRIHEVKPPSMQDRQLFRIWRGVRLVVFA